MIISASGRGLGLARTEALAQEGVNVVINGRSAERFENAATQIRRFTCGKLTPVVADVATTEGQAKLLEACPAPDILVNNNASPNPVNVLDFLRRLGSRCLMLI